ncbi:MAG: hypothetical protein V7709_02480 [Halioglobus sp.]
MVKKLISKADIRAEMDAEINRFKQDGGEVTEVPLGLSGRDKLDNSPPSSTRTIPGTHAQTHTRARSHCRD